MPFSGCSPTQFAAHPADDPGMRTRVIARTNPASALTLRTAAAAAVLLAVILAGSSGVLRVGVSAEPPAQMAPDTMR